MTIYLGQDTKIGYIEEGSYGSLPASPALQPVTVTSVITRGLDAGLIVLGALGTAKPAFILPGIHAPVLQLEFCIQNSTLMSLIEDPTKSYSFVILDDTGTSVYGIFEGCRVGGLVIDARVGSEVIGTLVLMPRSFRKEASITGVSWSSDWSETPFAWYNVRIELLTEVLGETPSGSGTGPYTCASSPFADRDEDGGVDDIGDIDVYDATVEEPAASVDSSAGTFMLTESPGGAVTVDYVYETPFTDIIECRLIFEWNMNRVHNVGTDGDKARAIREGGLDVSGNLSYTVEGSTTIDAILGGTEYWGFQFKFGLGENGTLRVRLKDKFKWGELDAPSEADMVLTGNTPFKALNFNIF